VIVLGDAPEAWEALGFRVDEEMVALGEERLQLTGRGSGILEVTTPGLTADDPDGLPLRAGEGAPADLSPHPNGAFAVDHVVVLTGSLDRTVAALEDAGLELRRRDGGMAFLRLGSYILEVVERGGDPARFWGLVVVVPDPGAVHGAGPAKNAVQPGRRIATVKGLGTALAVMSRRV
jgi:catechol 2,3-dioxygenase-like lactoylglutathione lyase family enzyme